MCICGYKGVQEKRHSQSIYDSWFYRNLTEILVLNDLNTFDYLDELNYASSPESSGKVKLMNDDLVLSSAINLM